MTRPASLHARRHGARRAGALAAVVLALPLLGGCKDDASADRSIEFWTISLRPRFTEYIEQRISAFEAERPGVDVRWVDAPFDALERKLIAAYAAGRSPDVVNLSDMMFARYAGAGAFLDLDEALPPDVLDRYHEGALAVGRLGDRQLALPWYLTTQAMICNTALLAEGGLSPDELDRTWPELLDRAETFHERTGDRWLFTQPIGTDSQLPMMLLAEGLAPFRIDDDGLLAPDLTRPDVLGFLERWVDVYRAGALPREAATRDFGHLIDVYKNERVALVNTGANFLEQIRDESREVYDQTVVLPPVTGSLGAAHIAVMPICVSAQTDHPESQLAFCRLAPILPSTAATLDDPFFSGPTDAEKAAGVARIGEARAVVAETLDSAYAFTPAIECWPDLRRIFNEHFKAVLLSGADLEAEMQACERAWSRMIDDMNERRIASGGSPAGSEALPAPARHAATPTQVAR